MISMPSNMAIFSALATNLMGDFHAIAPGQATRVFPSELWQF